jgi:hypothetical protein
MIYASAASTPARLGIGTAGQVLTVSGGVPAWTTIAAGGVTSVTGTAPIASSGGATPAISITPGTARQLLQTNAGGTAAEFASNIDVPGTLDVTGVATFDSTVTVAGTHLQLNAQGDLRFADADSSNYVAFQAPATVAANVTWTLPAADGTAGAVLSTNASGVTSWNDLGNGVALNGTAIKVSIGSASAPPTVGTPAANAMTGSMYWDDVAGAMFYRYDNGGTPVWVQASAGGGGSTGSFLPLAGGTMTGAIVNAAGAVATPSLTFTGDLDTGIFSPSAGQVAIANNGTQSVTVDASGRVLIGTTTAPSAGDGQFDLAVVQGNTSGATGHGSISIQRGEAATSIISGEDIGYIKFNDSSGNSFAQIRCTADANAGSGDYPGRLSFFTTADGAAAPVEAMRINSSRQLLINGTTVIDSGSRLQIIGFTYSSEGLFTGNKTAAGNTAPIAQITVPGCYFPSGVNVGTSKVAEMTGADTSGSVPLLAMSRTGSTGEVIRFYNSSTSVGNINISATTTTYATSSDYRLKENVVPLEDATDRLKQLPVHRFNFIADPDKTVDGFLAHEAQAVVPECVTGEKDAVDEDGNPRYQGIDQSKLVPLLTAALQEALAEIESLKARLDAAGV